MTAAGNKPRAPSGGVDQPCLNAGGALSIDDLVLMRVAATTATRADLQRDLANLSAPKITGTAFRRAAERAINALIENAAITEHRSRLTATDAGRAAASKLLGQTGAYPAAWSDVRDGLLLNALGLKQPSPSILKALARPEGLAALMLQKHYMLGVSKVLSPTTLRSELAVIALERAFGNKIKTGLGKGSGLPGKAGRILAGQLFKQPRDVATDGKLVVLLAAEIFTAADTSVDAFATALLRRLTGAPTTESAIQSLDKRLPRPSPAADNDASPMPVADTSALRPTRPAPRTEPIRPDMPEFASAVVSAARPVSEGWPGSRKAFISLVWNAIRDTRPEWELSEVAFKSMLAEAHRTGHVVLAGADLKDKCDLKELEDSKILYKNTVWHFVRVED